MAPGMLASPRMPVASRRLRRLLLVLGAVLAPLVGAEVYFRVADPLPPQWGWRDLFQRPQELNQLGLRGQAIAYGDDDLVVVLVGDSQVEGDACVFPIMPERRLEHHLGLLSKRSVKVFSVGCIGYGHDQQLLGLEEYLARYRADAVVAWFTDANDVWNNVSAVHSGGSPAKPTFWLDAEDSLCGPTARVGEPVYSRLRVLAKLQQLGAGPLDDAWDRRLPPAYVPMAAFDGPAVADWKLFATTAAEMAKERTPLQLGLTPPSPRTRYGIRLANLLLQRMQARAQAAGATFASMVVDRPDFPLADGVYAFDTAAGKRFVRYSKERHWRGVREVHAGIDLLMLTVKVDPFCTKDDPHFNPLAVDQIMADLAVEVAARLRR